MFANGENESLFSMLLLWGIFFLIEEQLNIAVTTQFFL